MIYYRVADNLSDMERIVDLELAVWGIQERDAFPPHMLLMAKHHGGVILIAEDEHQLMGFNVGFPALRDGKLVLWSYITGIHPDYQGKGVGSQLKNRQRSWAAGNGYTTIHWTFDPLQAANANFNLNHLGAIAVQYHENFYGEMNDSINKVNLPSDRLEASWYAKASKNPDFDNQITDHSSICHWIEYKNGMPVFHPVESDNQAIAIAIPPVKDETNYLDRWQQSIRQAFHHAFSRGYIACQFIRENQQAYYVLRQPTNSSP